MIKNLLILMLFFCWCSTFSFANNKIEYRYDKYQGEIYAKIGDDEKKLKFHSNEKGNPSYTFGFFSGEPAIIADARSLHDSTVYATLKLFEGKFFIDCLYYNIKSKRNGVLFKEGVCGLNVLFPKNYSFYLDEKINEVKSRIDEIDTGLILNGKAEHLTMILHNKNNNKLYKVYSNKESMLNDEYLFLSLGNDGVCKVFMGNPWLIYKDAADHTAVVMSEELNDGQVNLVVAAPKATGRCEYSLFSAISVKVRRSYFYNSPLKVSQSYLIEGDEVNLLSRSSDDKFCNVNYINDSNKIVNGSLLCSDLNL